MAPGENEFDIPALDLLVQNLNFNLPPTLVIGMHIKIRKAWSYSSGSQPPPYFRISWGTF